MYVPQKFPLFGDKHKNEQFDKLCWHKVADGGGSFWQNGKMSLHHTYWGYPDIMYEDWRRRNKYAIHAYTHGLVTGSGSSLYSGCS